ncbi:ABC transporter ATP-binding protein [Yinghuangia sp. ASG 101]|uniref:ABC transporter ATP-binding protein n=1 Tax=Yinghuangia sp. ASG 101 TaxID=2896848 RepID=UPI001E356DCD|nr:ABC transporter ATP-binding protein [Yinghuangia sp. ASG 101]UGQ11202.1 ABC transporter ATP-binding protein [Yinghuangia sp. ASG 101]
MTGTDTAATTASAAPAESGTPVLALRGVHAGYGDTTVLRDVDLSVAPGAVVALLGANGAGKTTLLRTVCGLNRATAGSVELHGTDIARLPAHRRTALGLCHIPEGRGVFRSLTVRENLYLQAEPGRNAQAIEAAVQAFPALGKRLDSPAGTLSGGQQQMLAMAQAHVRDPKLVLVDEASLGLAPVVVDEVFAFLRQLADRGTALLLVDQFVTRVLKIATHAYVLRRGRIVYDGTPQELRSGSVFEQYIGAA